MSCDEYDNILFDKTDEIKIIKKLTDFEGPIDRYFLFTVHSDTLQEDQSQGYDTFYVFKKILIKVKLCRV
jgi:hypothetical protein